MDTKPYQKLPNDVFFGKHVYIVILDLISGVEWYWKSTGSEIWSYEQLCWPFELWSSTAEGN